MGSRTRVWPVVLGLALAGVLATGCGGSDAPEASTLSAEEGTTTIDPTAALDPITRDTCDKVWSFGTQAYAANVTTDASPQDAENLRAEVARTADEAATWKTDMAADIKLLAAYAQQATKTSDHPDPPADVAAANQRLVDYLETTCKLTLG
jgi:hypothetical protein